MNVTPLLSKLQNELFIHIYLDCNISVEMYSEW